MRGRGRAFAAACVLTCLSLFAGLSASAAAAKAATTKSSVYRLGAICSCSGVQAPTNALEAEGLILWVKNINATGGLNGHKIALTSMDDAGIPATALKDVEQMVQSDHIQALVDMSLGDQSFEKYVDSTTVPVIGGQSVLSPFLTDPDWFASGANALTFDLGQVNLAKSAGKTVFGTMYCVETPLCATGSEIVHAAAGISGLTFFGLPESSVSTTYAAPCLQLKSDGVNAFYPIANETVGKAEVDQCAQQGYNPLVVGNATAGIATWVTDSNFNGALLVNGSQLPENVANPGVAALRAAVKKYDPSIMHSPQFDALTVGAYAAGVMFGQVVTAGKLTPSSTPAQFKAAVPKINGTTLDGLSPKLTIKAGKPVSTPCYFGFEIETKQVLPLNGGKASCVSPALVASLSSALHL